MAWLVPVRRTMRSNERAALVHVARGVEFLIDARNPARADWVVSSELLDTNPTALQM